METNIIGLYKVLDLLKEDDIKLLEEKARHYIIPLSVYFKISKIDKENKKLVIQVYQTNDTDRHLTELELKDIAQEVFKVFINDWDVSFLAKPYEPNCTDMVNSEWIVENMEKFKISAKQLVKDFGVSKSEISLMINGKTKLSNRVKPMFYYYFEYLKIKKELDELKR